MKIGMYTEDEIFNYMTNCEGSMLGRSMYDAIFDKIYALITENEQQEKDIVKYKSLYQNEKDKNDTLNRVIKKIEEYINKNNLFCYKYDEEELFEIITDKEAKKYLLDLLKEIK